MAEETENITTCGCGCKDAALQGERQSDVLLIDENGETCVCMVDASCDCGCEDIELVIEHQPDVLLMDEYAEPYENDIIKIREIAEEWEEIGTREDNATANKNSILSAISSALTTIGNAITAAKEAIMEVVTGNSDKLDTLLARTASFPEETTADEIDSLF